MWFIGVEVEQETSAPPPKKNPGSTPAKKTACCMIIYGFSGGSANSVWEGKV